MGQLLKLCLKIGGRILITKEVAVQVYNIKPSAYFWGDFGATAMEDAKGGHVHSSFCLFLRYRLKIKWRSFPWM